MKEFQRTKYIWMKILIIKISSKIATWNPHDFWEIREVLITTLYTSFNVTSWSNPFTKRKKGERRENYI